MGNLRVTANKDLQRSMESENDWGLLIVLIDPEGNTIDTKKDSEDRLSGQVLLNYTEYNPDTGEDVIINDPVAVLRLESLTRIPANGEKWIVKLPEKPDPDAAMISYALSPTKAMKFNRSLGFVRMYLQKITQS